MWHAYSGLLGGRYRRYLSLREGLEQPPGGALKEGARTYEMARAGPFPESRFGTGPLTTSLVETPRSQFPFSLSLG